jgi:hypothetical protein
MASRGYNGGMERSEMASTWTVNMFSGHYDARAFAEHVTTSGGRVISIAYGVTHPEDQLSGWCVFASFHEAIQAREAAITWEQQRDARR